MGETYRPTEANLGKDCMHWRQVGSLTLACRYPKAELEGRTSCEGMVDDVCLWKLTGRAPVSLTDAQMDGVKLSFPHGPSLPPGEVI